MRGTLYTAIAASFVAFAFAGQPATAAPATAALAGFVFLGQHLSWLEIAGIGLVILASIGAIRSSARAAREAAEPLA